MIKRVLFSVVALLFYMNSSAQYFDYDDLKITDWSYYESSDYIEKAFGEDNEGRHLKSLYFFDKAFGIKKIDPFHYLCAFEAAVKAKELEKAYVYLVQGTLASLDLNNFLSDEVDYFFTTSLGKQFLKIQDSLKTAHDLSIDTIYRNKLFAIYELDQMVNRKLEDANNVRLKDCANFKEILNLSEKFGFPTYEKVGGAMEVIAEILCRVSDDSACGEMWQKLLPLIVKEINNGNLHVDFLTGPIELEPEFIEE